jgi:KDO2-lipid IV(A) lauroyltransferase
MAYSTMIAQEAYAFGFAPTDPGPMPYPAPPVMSADPVVPPRAPSSASPPGAGSGAASSPAAPAHQEQAPAPEATGRWLVGLASALASLPLGAARGLGAAAGLAALALSASYRGKLRANLGRAGYRGVALMLRAAIEAGRMAGELPFIWMRPSAAIARRVHCDDLAVLEAAERAGRGILFLTPHLGAFEVTARWYALRAPITVMFRPPRKPALGALLARARGGEGLHPVPAALSGVRAMLRALRAGAAVGVLPDQVPGAGEGRWAGFFGEPAFTMTLPMKLAQATDASVVIAVGERVRGGWRIRLQAFESLPTPEALNAQMEELVRLAPHQYLWGYNRYKRPDGAPAAPVTPR